MIRRTLLATLATLALLPASASAAPAKAPAAAAPRVRLITGLGPIVIQVDPRHAPITSGNFLRYVDAGKLDGTTFYRAARAKGGPKDGLVQGGIQHSLPRSFAPIKHEPTSQTGLKHVDGTVSMARDAPGTAMGDFFIVVGPGQYLDATRKDPGYAAFGHVVSGMDVVRKILAAKTFTGGWSSETVGQSIMKPIPIVSAKRLP